MTTITDQGRGNFNADAISAGDLLLFDNFGNEAIWLENGAGGRLISSPAGFNLPFTGPTWHIVAAADFDGGVIADKMVTGLGGTNATWGSHLLFQNDNGALAIWQSNGSNVNP